MNTLAFPPRVERRKKERKEREKRERGRKQAASKAKKERMESRVDERFLCLLLIVIP